MLQVEGLIDFERQTQDRCWLLASSGVLGFGGSSRRCPSTVSPGTVREYFVCHAM